MRISSPFSLVACSLMLMGAGCAFRHKKNTISAPAHRLIGTIVSVNDSDRFVLIDAGTFYVVSKGEALKSFLGDQETAVLTVSPERKPPFIIADIVKGTPHQGDQVFD